MKCTKTIQRIDYVKVRELFNFSNKIFIPQTEFIKVRVKLTHNHNASKYS